MRAFRNLDGKSCPGEHTCITDEAHGEIAGVLGTREGRTLQNYCHNNDATKDNGLKTGCPLFDTKPENVPPSLFGAIDAAELLRRYKQRGTLPPISELTAWEYCCFDAAEEAADAVEAEYMRESMKKSESSGSKVGDNSPLGKMGQVEKNGAINW